MGGIYGSEATQHPRESTAAPTAGITVYDRAAALEDEKILQKLGLLTNASKADPLIDRIRTLMKRENHPEKEIRNMDVRNAFFNTPFLEELESSAEAGDIKLVEAYTNWKAGREGMALSNALVTKQLQGNPLLDNLKQIVRVQNFWLLATNGTTIEESHLHAAFDGTAFITRLSSPPTKTTDFLALETAGTTIEDSHITTAFQGTAFFNTLEARVNEVPDDGITTLSKAYEAWKSTVVDSVENAIIAQTQLSLVESYNEWASSLTIPFPEAIVRDTFSNTALANLSLQGNAPSLLIAYRAVEQALEHAGGTVSFKDKDSDKGDSYYTVIGDRHLKPSSSELDRTLRGGESCTNATTFFLDNYSESDTYSFQIPESPQVGQVYLSSIKIEEVKALVASSSNHLNPAHPDVDARGPAATVKPGKDSVLFDNCVQAEDPKELIKDPARRDAPIEEQKVTYSFSVFHNKGNTAKVLEDKFVLTVRGGQAYLQGDSEGLIGLSDGTCTIQWGECHNKVGIDAAVEGIRDYLGIDTLDLASFVDENPTQ
jgi:hypothetical protein